MNLSLVSFLWLIEIQNVVSPMSLNSPYSLALENILNLCLRNSGKSIRINKLLDCIFEKELPNGKINLNQFYKEIDENFDLNIEDYNRYSEKYNALLESILKNRVIDYESARILKSNKNVEDPEIKKLIEDSIKYRKDFCENYEEHRNTKIENLITRTIGWLFGKSIPIYVYASNDIVGHIIRKYHTWEETEVTNMINAIERYRKKHTINNPSDVTVLDIGANIGWYTIQFCLQGYHVMSFEPMLINDYIIHRNFCFNQSLNVTYVNVGLSDQDKNCSLYSERENKGNGEL